MSVQDRQRPTGRAGAAADVLFALLGAAVLAFTADRFAHDGRAWVFDTVADGTVCAAALARRRHPLAAAIAGLAVSTVAAVVATLAGLPSEPGAAAILALAVLAITAVRVLPSVPATAIALCGVFVAGAGRLGTALGYQTSHAAYRVGAETWLAAVALGLWLRYLDRRRHDTAERVRRDERLAMARELHDVVAHHITGIVLQTQAARITARRGQDPEDLDDALTEIEAAGTEALTAMRRVVALLRDTDDAVTTAAGTGPEDLAELVARFAGHGPAVTLSMPQRNETQWPPEIASTVYRVVQESLTNIARHAMNARSATIAITQGADGIRVEVADDAPATPPRHLHRPGFGLIGMRERVEALGGTLEAGQRAGGGGAGWVVSAVLPVSRSGPDSASCSDSSSDSAASLSTPTSTSAPGAPR
ncbi:sensor histidine kinase [Catenulispora sp. GP43]|uniref:sensor histidine kinase n=1 Tax=Catenulispora sp. GP43 TaxID=3156263 RepID=UPI003517ADB3